MWSLTLASYLTLFGFGLTFHHQWSEEEKGSVRECLEINSMTMEEYRSGWKENELPEKNLCVRKCVLEKLGFLDEDGILQKDKILNNYGDNMISECLESIEKIENCQDVKKFHQCMKHKMNKHNAN